MPRPLVIAGTAVLVLALGLAAAGAYWWRDRPQAALEQAAALAPPDAQRLSWTDWAGVREKLGARLDASSSRAALEAFLNKGYDADLTSTSALVESAPVLQARFGFSPAIADWELYAQSDHGALEIIKLPDDTDFDTLAGDLKSLGYTPPPTSGEVWDGGSGLLPRVGAELSPELQYVALEAGSHLVLASDSPGYLQQQAARLGDGDLPAGLQEAVDASGSPLSAALYSGDYTCSALAMANADASDQREGARLLAAAGPVTPLLGFGMSDQPDGQVRVVMTFPDADQARTNATTRAALARGPAPGQGGSFGDRFSVESVTAAGSVVTMDLRPQPGAYVLSDLSTGPLLFATC